MAAIDSELLRELLDRWPVGRLGTLDRGVPHIVPIVFCRADDALYSPVDGKAKGTTRLKRLANVQRDPRFSLLLDHYDLDWTQLWWVRLDGTADIYQPGARRLATLRELLLEKYPQYAHLAMTGARPTFLRLTWQKVTAWAQEELTRELLFPEYRRM